MKVFRAYGYNVHVKAHEAIFPLFPGQDNPRRVPRNSFDYMYAIFPTVLFAFFMVCYWFLSHIPFLMIFGAGMFVISICMLVLTKVYMDSTRAMWMLALATTLLLTKTTFGFTFLGFHLETYVYYIAIGASLLALWLRLYNYLCWKQVDYVCEKYGIPKYDQRELMNAYEGQETNYGRAPQKTYATFDEALAARKAGTDNARVEE